MADGGGRRLLAVASAYLTIVILSIAAYMTLQFRRFGSFQITSMTGYGLYWNVNLLTDLNGPVHPEVKRELRSFFPLYFAKYGTRGENLGDWVLWGSRTPEIEKDFGSWSPSRVVRDYAANHGSGSIFHRMDRVFMDLAVEGIRAHPLEYLKMSLRSTWGLVEDGLTFSYSVRPISDTADIYARAEFFRLWSVVAHRRSEHLRAPPGQQPLAPRSFFVSLPELVGRFLWIWLPPIAIAGGMLGAAIWAVGGRAEIRALAPLIPPGIAVVSFILLCGFVVPGEPPRYMEPVQDLIVLLVLTLFAISWRVLSRASAEEGVRSSSSQTGRPTASTRRARG